MPYHRDEPGPADKEAMTLSYEALHRSVEGVDWPAWKRDLLHRARVNGASAAVVRALEHLPGDRFDDAAALNRAYRRAGGAREGVDL